MTVAESGKPLSAPFVLIRQFLNSSIGAKVLMALSGIVVWGFAIGHVLGNLQVLLYAPVGGYLGQQINEYAYFLKTTPWLLWGTRAVVGGGLLLHIYFGLKLAAHNRAARKSRYASGSVHERSTLASRFMAVSGVVLLVFITFHIAHFTLGFVRPDDFALKDTRGMHDVYWMMRNSFSNPGIAAFYVVAMVLLFAHLFHGSVSCWQSLGLRHPRWTPLLRLGSRGVVILIVAGYLSIPIVLLSWSYAR
jgi:succinate dehydrogenase / fumarate reductase, cytochrome b subunit